MTIHENLLSDHHCIRFQLSLPSLKRHKIQRSVRQFKEMDIKGFTDLLQDKLTELPETTDVNTILTAYNSATSECLDKFAPRKTCSRSTRPRNLWFNENIQIARRKRRRAERKWRKNPSEANRSEFTDAIKNVNESIIHAKKDYLMETLDNADNRKVFQTLNHLLQRNIKVLPAHNCPLQLANSFAQYFKEKIMKIRESLASNVCTNANTVYDIDNNCCIDLKDQLSEFDTITEENVRNIVMKMSASSCQLDPQPTWLLKKCLSYNLNSVTRIVNASLQPGVFPSPAHEAIITPIIKKPSLDAEDLKNYRPVSNLCCVAKIIEKAAATQFIDHLNRNGLYDSMQSAYRRDFSTETALLLLQNLVLSAIDECHSVLLCFLI